jgi:YVTN family beta-propeller protein
VTSPARALYVTNELSGDPTVIDVTTGIVTATVPLGKRPRGVAVSPDQTMLHVALSGSPNAGPGVGQWTIE